MKNILYTFLLVSCSFFVVSCNNGEDTEAPTIEIIKPLENEVVYIGNTLHMKFRFTDQSGVGFYSYQLFHQNGVVPGEFLYKNELDINGVLNEFEINHSVNIPLLSQDSLPTAAGDYVLRVIAMDWYNNRNVVDRVIKLEKNPANN